MERIKVYGYTRVSTTNQAEEGESLEVQRIKIQEYCKRKNIDLIDIYTDAGISGSIPPNKRPGFNMILTNLKMGQAKGLVACKIDRISRSMHDFINLIEEFKGKYEIFVLDPDIDTNSTIGLFTIRLLSNIAELERDMIKSRTADIMNQKRLKGELIGSVPFGKKLCKDASGNFTKQLEDDPTEIKTIKLIHKERAIQVGISKTKKGVCKPKYKTYDTIAKILIEKGYKNKNGDVKWFPATIKRILDYEREKVMKAALHPI